MSGISNLMKSLGTILNQQLQDLNAEIDTKGKCVKSDRTEDSDNDTETKCINAGHTWKPDDTTLEGQRKDILKYLKQTLNTEFDAISDKNILLSQLKTVGDNIDENDTYIKAKIDYIKRKKQNHKKMLEIANYEYERFYEFKTMIKTIVYGLLIILFVMFLIKQPWFPTTVGVVIISVVVAYLILTTLSRFFTNMRRNDRSYSVINQTEKNHKYNSVGTTGGPSAPQIKEAETLGEMIFGTNSCDNFIGHKSIPYQTNFNNLKSFRT